MSYCVSCGRELDPDEVFCKKCGTHVVAPPLPQEPISQEPPVHQMEPMPQVLPTNQAETVSAPAQREEDASGANEDKPSSATTSQGKAQEANQSAAPEKVKSGLLGYRSRSIWKMWFASLWYGLCVLVLLAGLFSAPQFECSQEDLTRYWVSTIFPILPFVLVPVLLSSFKIYEKLPGKNNGRLLRVCVAVLATIVLFGNASEASDNFSQEYKDNKAAYEAAAKEEKAAANADKVAQEEAEKAKVDEVKAAERAKAEEKKKAEEEEAAAAKEAEEAEKAAEEPEKAQAPAVSTQNSAHSSHALVKALVSKGYTRDEAEEFYDVVAECGLANSVANSNVTVVENGSLTTVKMSYSAGLCQVNATAEDHVVFYIEWTRAGLTQKSYDSVVMYDADAGGYKNYYSESENKFTAWANK